jgi:hypothetical protein
VNGVNGLASSPPGPYCSPRSRGLCVSCQAIAAGGRSPNFPGYCLANFARHLGVACRYLGPSSSFTDARLLPYRGQAAYLRLTRRGNELLMGPGRDGRERELVFGKHAPHLPDTVQVGVFAEPTSDGPFVATFDELRFTQPGAAGR